MPGNMTLETLKDAVSRGEIDTVLVAGIDMQGRLMGKRFHAQFFVDGGWEETHCCNYLLTVDMEMTTVQGYKSSSWQTGYGDYVLKPDLSPCAASPGCRAPPSCWVTHSITITTPCRTRPARSCKSRWPALAPWASSR